MSIMLIMTCISFQVFRGYHDHETDCPLIAKHFVGPTTDGAHAFDCCNAIVGNKHLDMQMNQNIYEIKTADYF